jgi:hypothetical protein
MKTILGILLIFFSTTIRAQTKFGVMVFGRTDINTKIKVAKELGVSYVRDGIAMGTWSGQYPRLDKWQNAGFKLILNVSWGAQQGNGTVVPIPYPTDTVEYKKILTDILSRYRPEILVVENEEMWKKYHTGPIEDYINELTAAVTVAHEKGIKVTNGGLTNRELVLSVYNDYLERGMKKDADDFKDRCIKPSLLNEDNADAGQIASDAKKLIAAYKRLPLDYVNIHVYEPIKNLVVGTDESAKQITPKAFEEIVNYVEKATGKKIMTNEIGARTHSTDIVSQMLDEVNKAGLEYCLWFSGDAPGGAVALHNDDGSLRESGEAFKKFVEDHK